MRDLLAELPPLLSAIGRSLLMGTLTLLLVGSICRGGERFLSANLRCFIWRLSYIKLLLGLGGVAWFVRLPVAIPAPKTPTSVVPPAAPAPTPIPMSIAADAESLTAPIASPTATVQQMPAIAAPVQSAAAPTPSYIDFARFVLPALAGLYLVGLLICITRLIFSLRRMQRVLRASIPVADTDAITALQSLARRLELRHVPALRQSAGVSSPFCATGTIVLPTDLVGTPEVPTILAHELAHARRRDLAWEWLGTLTQVLLFFHPLVLLARWEERIARESAADVLALAVTGTPPADYSRMLLALALKPRPFAAVGAIGVLGGTGLRRRLLALRSAASAKMLSARQLWAARLLGAVLAAVAITPLSISSTRSHRTGFGLLHAAEPVLTPIPPSALIPATDPRTLREPKYAPHNSSKLPSDYFAPTGTQRLVGVVQDENGSPVPGASVCVFYSNANQTGGDKPVPYLTPTDSHGAFKAEHLAPGVYQILALTRKHEFPSAGIPNVTIAPGVKTSVVIKMRPGIRVSGRVINRRSGAPLAEIFLSSANLQSLADSNKPATEVGMAAETKSESDFAISDADGRYTLCVPTGDSFIKVGHSATNTSPRVRDPQIRKLHTPQGAALTQNFTVDVPPTLKFVGEDGKPLTNVSVWLSPDPKSHKSSHIVATDANGSVSLSDFNGDFDNGSFSATYADLRISGAFQSGPNGLLSVTVGKTTRTFPTGNGIVSMTHPSSAFLLGRVVDPQGRPIPQAVLALYSSELHSVYGLPALHYHPDAQGRFRLPLSLNQRYALSVRADGFNAVEAIKYISLTPYAGMQKDVGTVTLQPARGSISGQIVDEHGKPVAQAILAARGGQTNVAYAITDSQGSFKISNVVPGELLRLEVCQHGMVTDGEYGFQSSKSWYRTGVRAGMNDLRISLRPEQVSQTLPIESHP